MATSLLNRFCLYGFLKNQQYFEPFLILYFRQAGLSFFDIGLLIALRQLALNALEVPSGALADVWGRRACMVLCLVFYVGGFVLLGTGVMHLAPAVAMVLLGAGDAFRTGTHKAIIMTWLQHEGRQAERTRVYGFTRSWAKLGSLASAAIAGGLVFWKADYTVVFWAAVFPYALNIVNILSYPRYVDGERTPGTSVADAWRDVRGGIRRAARNRPLRALLIESMSFDGLYESVRNYLQPILKRFALSLPLLATLEQERRTALVVAVVYAGLGLVESVASRQSYRLARALRGDPAAARAIWRAEALVMALLLPCFALNLNLALIAGFLVLAVLFNFFRPVTISRVDRLAEPRVRATILSVESQGKALVTMLLAPLLGLAVDHLGFWTVAALGLAISLVMALRPTPAA